MFREPFWNFRDLGKAAAKGAGKLWPNIDPENRSAT